MERLRYRKIISAGAGLFLLGIAGLVESGCGYPTKEVNNISKCNGNQTPILATFLGNKNYKIITDHAYLAQQQESTDYPVGNTLSNGDTIVGIGTLVCRSDVKGRTMYYLTTI